MVSKFLTLLAMIERIARIPTQKITITIRISMRVKAFFLIRGVVV